MVNHFCNIRVRSTTKTPDTKGTFTGFLPSYYRVNIVGLTNRTGFREVTVRVRERSPHRRINRVAAVLENFEPALATGDGSVDQRVALKQSCPKSSNIGVLPQRLLAQVMCR
jgi:hypothetical protein